MESNISAIHYHNHEIFNREKKSILENAWIFIGFKSQLLNPGDFITRTIGTTPVVVQNMKGEVQAFLNVCSHRFSKLQTAECGNRALVCPYHGWAYDQNGIPTGIPKRPLFKDFTQEELIAMRLKEFKVDFCGDLCFVCLNKNSNSLESFLGAFYSELKLLSLSIGKQVDLNKLTINANWKVIVENTLESYHVASIHSNTFKKLGAQGLEFFFTGHHSMWNAELAVKRTDAANRKIDELFVNEGYKLEGYKHFLIFPNLLISTTHGNSFNFSVIEPQTPTETRFTSFVYVAKVASDHKKALLDAFEKSLADFNRQVFDEDRIICESVQQGVGSSVLQGVLSIEEERVHAFQKSYTELMKNDS
jgi:phenylpropionate dioxygenase-like ring-hydroxylating dioxygenase large terminal subunit